MNPRKVSPLLAAALGLLACLAAQALTVPCLTVSPAQQNCVLDSQGNPIYTWTLNVMDTLTCSGGAMLTLLSSPPTVPSVFNVPAPGTTAVSAVTFGPVTSLACTLTGCGQTCQAKAQLHPATSCGLCMDLFVGKPACANGGSGSQCTYTVPVTVTNNTGVSSLVQFSATTGALSPTSATVPPGVTTVSLTLQGPCGVPGVLDAKLFPGGLNAPHCEKQQPYSPKWCGQCDYTAVPQTGSLCAPGFTQVDLQPTPNVPAGAIAWFSTTNCATTALPPNPPWTTLSGGTSWFTLGLNLPTCYEASIQGLDGCPNPVLSSIAQVSVTPNTPAGPLQCMFQSGGACPSQMCAPVTLSLQAPPTPPGCFRTWEQDAGLGWQPITGVTGSSYSPPPLATTQCSSPMKFRSRIACAPCPMDLAEADFQLFEMSPLAAGMLTAVKPQICAGDDDTVNLTGSCPGAAIQWQISTDGINWTDIPGALGPTAWPTNPLFQKTWYQVKVTNGPCMAVYSPAVPITVVQPTVTISASGSTQFCAPGSVMLTATSTGGPGTYQWFKDGLQIPGSSPLTVTQTGNYWVVFTPNLPHCAPVKSNLIKVFASQIVPVISGPCGVCPPNCITLLGNAGGGLPSYTYSWSWNGGSSTGQTLHACPMMQTLYTLTVQDSLGCQKTVSQLVGVCPKFKVSAGTNLVIHHGMSTTLGGSPTATGGQLPYTYSWTPTAGLNNPAASNPVATPAATTLYTVTVTDSRGCSGTAQVSVIVL